MVLEEIIRSIIVFITSTISDLGYGGVFLLMVAESALIPIPSEVIMPFSGYLVYTGEFELFYVVLAGSLGNLAGSLIAYYSGSKLGREFILRYGRYVLLRRSHLELTETWFRRYGDQSAFIGRMLPAVRTYISLPAGLAIMNMKKFIVYTFIGSVIWNTALTYIGIQLGPHWETILNYTDYLHIAVAIGAVVLVLLFLRKRRERKVKSQDEPGKK